MAENPLPVELQAFIKRYIHSVEQLETLRIMAESPSREWLETEVFHQIQSSRESVAANLRFFTREKILAAGSPPRFRYAPEGADLARLIADLLKNYRERRVTVIDAIYREPLDPIQDFAAAFRIRKDRP